MTDCSCNNHHDASGFTAGLLLGLVTGAASAHYLTNSEQGKELLASLKENAGDALKELSENPALEGKIAELQKTMDAARAVVNSAAERVVDATSPARLAPKKNFFQRMGASLGK